MAYLMNCPTKSEVDNYFDKKTNANHLLIHCQKGQDNRAFITYKHEGKIVHLSCEEKQEGCIFNTINKQIGKEILKDKHLVLTSIVDMNNAEKENLFPADSVLLKHTGCCGIVPGVGRFRFCRGSCRSRCKSCYKHRTFPFYNVVNVKGMYTFVPPPSHMSRQGAISLYEKLFSDRNGEHQIDSVLYLDAKDGELKSVSTSELNSLINRLAEVTLTDRNSAVSDKSRYFTVITQPNCTYCKQATSLLRSANLPFEVVNATAELAKEYQITTTPHVLYSDSSNGKKRFVGGFDEIKALLGALNLLNTVVYWKRVPTFSKVYNEKRHSKYRFCGKTFRCGTSQSNMQQIRVLIEKGWISESDVAQNKNAIDIKADRLIQMLQQLKKSPRRY